MISKSQQKQIEKYVQEFQSVVKEGTDPQRFLTLLPEFYNFITGCKKQVEKELEMAQDPREDEVKAGEGLLVNLNQLQSSLLDTSTQLGIPLEKPGDNVTAGHDTQEIRVNFEQCPNDTLKNIIIQNIKETLAVEAPLVNSDYTMNLEPDQSISIRVTQHQETA